jgi:LPXTG-site transpeptidase (sortase) family protein
MAMPDDLQTVGWYGAIPGNSGKAVLAAHTGYPNKPSVFRKLDQLAVGDSVRVRDTVNIEAEFEITRIKEYAPQDAPRDQIFGDSPTQRLTLITCIGKWDPKTQTYSHRLIISAVRKS